MTTQNALETVKKRLRCNYKECNCQCMTCEYKVLPDELNEALAALVKKVEANGAPAEIKGGKRNK